MHQARHVAHTVLMLVGSGGSCSQETKNGLSKKHRGITSLSVAWSRQSLFMFQVWPWSRQCLGEGEDIVLRAKESRQSS